VGRPRKKIIETPSKESTEEIKSSPKKSSPGRPRKKLKDVPEKELKTNKRGRDSTDKGEKKTSLAEKKKNPSFNKRKTSKF